MHLNYRFAAVICLLFLSVLLFCSCNVISDDWKVVRLSGEPKTVTVSLEDSGNGIGLSVDLNFTNGGDNLISVLPPADGEAPYAVITYPSDLDESGFSAVQKNGILTVDTEKNCQFTTDAFSMTVYANVTSYDLVGNYTLKADSGNCKSETVSLCITGSAAVTLSGLAAESVSLQIDGAADVVLGGTADSFRAEINGAGALEARALAARSAAVTVNGISNAYIAVTDTLDAEINGAGSISYVGDPTVKKEINGLGSVAKLSDETT